MIDCLLSLVYLDIRGLRWSVNFWFNALLLWKSEMGILKLILWK
jgi:hypothetical protein